MSPPRLSTRARAVTLGLLSPVLLASAVTVATPAAYAAEGVVAGTADPDAVPGRYVIRLKPGATASASALAGSGVSASWSGGFAARLSAAQARRLAASPSVAIVEQDRVMRINTTYRSPIWNLDRIDSRSRKLSRSYTPANSGAGVTAYVIDTGIRRSHTQFEGRASYGYDFVGEDPYAADCHGHGTHVASTVAGRTYGVAKKTRVVGVRVLDCDGAGFLSDIVRGVDWVTANARKPAVANMSLGGTYSVSLEAAVEESILSGVTYAVAAGNEDMSACLSSPAAVPLAITVAASTPTDRRASFSNYGSCVDLFAPGTGIKSAVASSDTATATWDGTSMATPHVAGVAAMVLSAHPTWTPGLVRSAIVNRTTNGVLVDRGPSSPNRLLYVPKAF